jgi:hypothetical protein
MRRELSFQSKASVADFFMDETSFQLHNLAKWQTQYQTFHTQPSNAVHIEEYFTFTKIHLGIYFLLLKIGKLTSY